MVKAFSKTFKTIATDLEQLVELNPETFLPNGISTLKKYPRGHVTY